jgi:hypothetical protein
VTRAYRIGVATMALAMTAIGAALIVKGALQGKPIGLVLGGLFVAVGAGRLYLLRRT